MTGRKPVGIFFKNADRLRSELAPVFDEIIAGRTVKRSVHELKWGKMDIDTPSGF